MKHNNLEHLRHSCAHLLAAAVLDIWPETKRTIGPATDDGFYYDFEFKEPISEKDFARIEQKMRELVKSWDGFEAHEVSREEALREVGDNEYKKELIEEISKKGEKITFYTSGKFTDLCRGGHTDDPKHELKYFKLMSLAGAYWRGDEKNKMLTRIYGTCFQSKEDLEKYLWQLEEAKKRDHKKLGRELGLFIFSPSVGPGLPLLMPNGFLVRQSIEKFLGRLKKKNGMQFVSTPHIARSQLYIQSKHWQKYDAMMPPLKIEDDEYTLKPMNCPHHFQLYLAEPRSYKDLPLRLAENATVYRFEKSGEINGLLRVRAITQDDSHWFVPHNQLDQEIDRAIAMIKEIYTVFGLDRFHARISIRGAEDHSKYLGEETVWDAAEKDLVKAIEKHGIPYEMGEGEAAFYGPKIDFMVEDSLGRNWQLTTIQLDFNQPNNFDLEYTDTDGEKKRPAVLHIAFLGSIERFMAIIIEHYAGAFPVWLAPVQVAVLPISDKHREIAERVHQELDEAGIRSKLDTDAKSISYKIRQSTLQKVPYMVIIGDKEVEKAQEDKAKSLYVSVRARDGKDLGAVHLSAFIRDLKSSIEKHV